MNPGEFSQFNGTCRLPDSPNGLIDLRISLFGGLSGGLVFANHTALGEVAIGHVQLDVVIPQEFDGEYVSGLHNFGFPYSNANFRTKCIEHGIDLVLDEEVIENVIEDNFMPGNVNVQQVIVEH
eukprot:TRINITY_DN15544_c0_g1_i1.p3 TRINITY_DN15544_c0_g1~~TRINITY_DN15544_c0_g1_i1.p3  ORF type:complete len:124 (-),score=31.80 TRINITY_DN15544_c0_g1_i1:202-573(-)